MHLCLSACFLFFFPGEGVFWVSDENLLPLIFVQDQDPAWQPYLLGLNSSCPTIWGHLGAMGIGIWHLWPLFGSGHLLPRMVLATWLAFQAILGFSSHPVLFQVVQSAMLLLLGDFGLLH